MAVPENNRPPGEVEGTDARFVEQSHLTYVIPHETDLDIDEAFQSVDPSVSILDSIPRRESLFFDETVDVLLVLRTPWADEKTLRSHLSRLVISLDVHIANAPGTDQDKASPPAHDLIFSGTVEDMDDPFIVVDESDAGSSEGDEDEHEQHVYAIWKMPVFLARPRLRLRRPTALFHGSAGLRPADKEAPRTGEGYLQSGVPSGINLLEAFGSDPALEGVKPRLSALRVSRVAPLTQPKERVQSIRALKELRLDIAPVVHSRVRVSRPNTQPSGATLIGVLEVDFGGNFSCDITIDSITPALKAGTVRDLNSQPGLSLLPMTCAPHDHVTFLYALAPADLDDVAKNPTRDLEITINATAKLASACTPRLTLTWTTPLDFTVPVNPGFGPAMQPIRRSHRPSQLSLGGGEASFTAPSVSRPDSLPVLEASTRNTDVSVPDLGITMTFTAPEGPVYPGEVFSWKIYTVNRTQEKNPRKLAVVAMPRRRKHTRVLRPPSLSRPAGDLAGQGQGQGPGTTTAAAVTRTDLADAVLDDNIVHAMHKNSAVEGADIVCLSSEVRVGPLAPGTCHVAELKFMAVREGVLGVDAVRVVDLATQDHVDIRELPIVIVEKRP
ncbi:uncharacterized protein DNG_00411 [Cephalotrichum gorgonifer]|uniref:Trafficking protein particle complex II-specific subunit 65 IgD3 domain-containing protein n=1 Tax=Cephalotrichum gorgonifer TaxID=2041049 RepID=A0AAE8MPD1_9PEZI|nr:uncharacterized protein DNG_00411 [Cephalotrichum gorgonifer]